MSPVTVRANAESPVAVPNSEDSRTKAEFSFEEISEQTEFNAANQRTKNGESKVDAAYQALADRSGSLKGTNHKSSNADDEPAASKRETRRSNTRGSQSGTPFSYMTSSDGCCPKVAILRSRFEAVVGSPARDENRRTEIRRGSRLIANVCPSY